MIDLLAGLKRTSRKRNQARNPQREEKRVFQIKGRKTQRNPCLDFDFFNLQPPYYSYGGWATPCLHVFGPAPAPRIGKGEK